MSTRRIILLFTALGFASSTFGQCVLDPIRVERVEGHLLFGFQNKYRVLDRGEIQLLDPSNKHVLASAVVDQNGRFHIVNAKLGKFILAARSEGLIPAYVDVTVARPKGTRPKRLILVILGADATKECGGASITLKAREDIDAVVSAATRSPH